MGFNKNSDKEFNKIYNGMVPSSMANSGTDLDEACPEIYDAGTTAMVDSHRGSIPQASATDVINRRKA
jgi:hypothetical protein